MGKTFGVTALIFGIISIPFSAVATLINLLNILWGSSFVLMSVIGWIISGIAIIFGVLGAIFDDPKGLAVAGLVLGIFGLLIGFLLRTFLASFFTPIIP